MSLSSSRKIRKFAIYSRVLVIFLQALFNCLIPDHNAGVFNPPVHRAKRKPLDFVFDALFEGLRRWDGVYFIHVAEYGYTYENTLAFFPAFPLCVRFIANTVLYPLSYVTNHINILTFAACTVNFILFVESAKAMYELGQCILKDDRIAFKAALLFCMNPASIFFSAAYSETMFALFTFKGLIALQRKHQVISAIYFALSGLTRSNGLINVAFICYANFKNIVQTGIRHYNIRHLPKPNGASMLAFSLRILVMTIIQFMITFSPFVLYQYYGYTIYCNQSSNVTSIPSHITEYGHLQGYKMPHMKPSSWCYDAIPLAYSYIQNVHWKNGFLAYYEIRQIPNFLLALPMILLCVGAVVYYMKAKPFYCLTLGLYGQSRDHAKKRDDQDESSVSAECGYHCDDVYVYIVHLLFLSTFAVLIMHVQVTTRFIACSSPVIYWFVATLTTPTQCADQSDSSNTKMDIKIDKEESCIYVYQRSDFKGDSTKTDSSKTHEEDMRSQPNVFKQNRNVSSDQEEDSIAKDLDDLYDWDSKTWLHKAIFLYFHLYFFVGCAAFPNFLPWT